MVDQVSKRSDENHEIMDENDPLFELAQVVAGGDVSQSATPERLELVENQLTEEQRSSLTEADLQPQSVSPIDLESELMAGLDMEVPEPSMPETSEPEMTAAPVEQVLEPASAETVSAESVVEAEAVLPAENGVEDAQVIAEPVATETDFAPISLEDELMSELQIESAPIDEPLAEEAFVETAASPEISATPENLDVAIEEGSEFDLGPDLEEAVKTELLADDLAGASTVQEVSPEANAVEIETELAGLLADEPASETVQPDPFEAVEALASQAVADVESEDLAAAQQFGDTFVEEPIATGELKDDRPFGSDDLDDAFMAEFQQLESTQIAESANETDFAASLEGEFLESFEAELADNQPELAQAAPVASDLNAADIGVAAPVLAASAPDISTDAISDPAMFDDPAFNPEPEAKGSGFKMAAIAIGVALVAGLSAVGYGYFTNGGISGGEPPLIAADKSPVKQKPIETAKAGDVKKEKASYQKVEGQGESLTQETLVSGTEEVKTIETSKTEDRLTPSANANQETAPKSVNLRKVRTVTVKPDGTIVQNDPVVVAEPVNKVVETASAVVNNATDTVQNIANDVPVAATNDATSIDGAQRTGTIAVPSNSPLPKPEIRQTQEIAFTAPSANEPVVIKKAPAPKPVAKAKPKAVAKPKPAPAPKPAAQQPIQIASAPAAPAGGWVVQISSQRSQSAAESSLRNLKRRFPILNNQSIAIRRAQVQGKGTFYRVRVQAGSKQAASRFCSRLKSRGGSCFISK